MYIIINNKKQNTLRKLLTVSLTILLLSASNQGFTTPLNDFADVVDKISPAVVNISTIYKTKKTKKQPYGNNIPDNPYDLFRDFLEKEFSLPEQMRKMTGLGSGFIIASEGYIVTNYHVIYGADEINVMVGNDNEKTYKAKIIGQDQKTDIALLKIDAEKPLPYLEFGDSTNARVGQSVIAIGNPFGLGGTVTAGIISAKARYIPSDIFDDYIQTDAAINQGNSGGPLCDGITGKVLGVNNRIFTSSDVAGNIGIGFAIPSSVVVPVIAQLKEKGSIDRGWLGVTIQSIDENLAKAIGLDKPKGALVTSIVNDSPAHKAGIQIGDVILQFDEKAVDSTNKLPKIVGDTQINKKVSIEIFRDGKLRNLDVLVSKLEQDDPLNQDIEQTKQPIDKNSKTVLGIKVSNLNSEIRKFYNIDSSAKGIVVTDIEKNSILAFTGVRAGDLIMSVSQKSINNIDDFEKAFDEIKRKGKNSAMILISHKGINQFIGIELK